MILIAYIDNMLITVSYLHNKYTERTYFDLLHFHVKFIIERTANFPTCLCGNADEAVEFLVTFTTSSVAPAPVYCLLTGRLAGRLRVSVTEPDATDRFPSVRELDPVLPDVQLDQLR